MKSIEVVEYLLYLCDFSESAEALYEGIKDLIEQLQNESEPQPSPAPQPAPQNDERIAIALERIADSLSAMQLGGIAVENIYGK